MRQPPEHRFADEQPIGLRIVAVYAKVLAIAEVDRLADRREIGKHQLAACIDHAQLRDEAAIGLQLLLHVILKVVRLFEHVLAHIQQHDIHQADGAAHMRLEGSRQVHRILARGRSGQRTLMPDLAQHERPHRHQRKQQHGRC